MTTKRLLILLAVLVVVIGSITYLEPRAMSQGGEVACTMEAKICPDGSSVGRTGPHCEFAACPTTPSTTEEPTVAGAGEHCGGNIRFAPICGSGYHCQLVISRPDTGGTCVADTSATLHAGLSQRVTGAGISITPLAVVSESRCPVDVQCIWAGTVELEMRVEDGTSTNKFTLKLGESTTTKNATITFSAVSPERHSGVKTLAAAYQFTFEVSKR